MLCFQCTSLPTACQASLMGWWAKLSGVLMMAAWGVVNTPGAVFIIPAIGGILAVLFFLALGVRILRRGIPASASS